jgi:predicted dinucleotide-binding enzyme
MTTAPVGPLTIAVLGAGVVGRTLATGWAKAGHTVVLGSRDPAGDKTTSAVQEVSAAAGSSRVSAAAHHDAAARADATVITVPGKQVAALVDSLGSSLNAKVVVDATNNTSSDAGALNSLDLLRDRGAVAYRAFNTVGWEQMDRPYFGTLQAAMPFTGPEGPGAAVVEQLIADIGFEAVALGDSAGAVAAVDAIARLWFLLAFERGYGRRVAWRLLTERDDQPPASG